MLSNEDAQRGSVGIIKENYRNGTLRQIFSDWKWILSFTKCRSRSVVIYTVLGMVTSALSIVTGIVSKYLIDAIAVLDARRTACFAVLALAGAALALCVRSVASRFGARLYIDMQNDVLAGAFDSFIYSDWTELSRFSTGDLLNRFGSDIPTVASNAVSWLPNALIHIFTVAATLAAILYYDPIMALICFASTPILFLSSRRLIKKQRSYAASLRRVSSDISAFESETFRNIDTLKSFGVEQSVSEELTRRRERLREASLEHNGFMIRTNICLTAMSTAVQYLALAYCLFRLWRGDILLGTMVFFLQQRGTLGSSFSSLISLIPSALSGSVAAERLREITTLEKEPETKHAVPHIGRCGVYLKDVCVKYRDGTDFVLSGASLTARPGETVALVGPSGEGKTTLLRVILGLIGAESGTLELVDTEGSSYPLGVSTRYCISYVPQGNTVMAGSIAENLRMACPDADDAQLEQVLRDACAWDFVSKMSDGINSVIGEGGKGISEGQAQRLSIARALLRKAPVMLLDEATSALDAETEQRILENIARRHVTCIVTTHRSSVLSVCARVYKIENNTLICRENGES